MTTYRLWELPEELEQLETNMETILESEELDEEQQQEQLNELLEQWLTVEKQVTAKANGIANLIVYYKALTKARKEEADRLRKLAAQSAKKTERLQEYLTHHLLKINKTKIEGVDHSLFLRKKPPQLTIEGDLNELPDEFCTREIKPDKMAIKRALKEGRELSFAHMVDSLEYSLIIK